MLVLGIISFLTCIFACCAGAAPSAPQLCSQQRPGLPPAPPPPLILSIVMSLFAVKHKSTIFAVAYLIFMGFLFIVEIGSPPSSLHLHRLAPLHLAFCLHFLRPNTVTHTQLLPPFPSPLPKTTSLQSKTLSPTRPKACELFLNCSTNTPL